MNLGDTKTEHREESFAALLRHWNVHLVWLENSSAYALERGVPGLLSGLLRCAQLGCSWNIWLGDAASPHTARMEQLGMHQSWGEESRIHTHSCMKYQGRWGCSASGALVQLRLSSHAAQLSGRAAPSPGTAAPSLLPGFPFIPRRSTCCLHPFHSCCMHKSAKAEPQAFPKKFMWSLQQAAPFMEICPAPVLK